MNQRREDLAELIDSVDIIREKGETRPYALRIADAVLAAGWDYDLCCCGDCGL